MVFEFHAVYSLRIKNGGYFARFCQIPQVMAKMSELQKCAYSANSLMYLRDKSTLYLVVLGKITV